MDSDEGTNTHENLSSSMTVIALVNGMIGGIILVMPISALKSGYLMIAPIVVVSAIFSYYSCLLCVRHLRNYKDLDEAVLKHFGDKRIYKVLYDLCIAISLIVLLILYFDLICKQWEGITTDSNLIPLLNAIFLFPLIYIMKKYHFGASLMAYGIISTIGYCLFILYMWIIAPEGEVKWKAVDRRFPALAAGLGQGLAIQAFFIPILKQNGRTNKFKRLLLITYIIGASAYIFIGYGGALSILNKVYPSGKSPETITQYFAQDEWQVVLVQIIYLVHLYSAFPEFLLISKKRFFSVLEYVETSDVSFKEVIYAGIVILICLIVKLTSISAETLIELNGSVISFIFIVIIPVGIHVKCVYFTPRNKKPEENWEEEEAKKEGGQTEDNEKIKSPKNLDIDTDEKLQEIELEKSEKKSQSRESWNAEGQEKSNDLNPSETGSQPEPTPVTVDNERKESSILQNNHDSNHVDEECCDILYKSKLHEYGEILLLTVMTLSGIITMVYTIYLIATKHDEERD